MTTPSSLELGIGLDLRAIAPASADARAFLQRAGVGADVCYLVDLALEEVLSNIVRHGGAPATTRIDLTVRRLDGAIELHFVDHGRAFDPVAAPAARTESSLATRAVGGAGLVLLRRLMSSMHYERIADANHLRVSIRATA